MYIEYFLVPYSAKFSRCTIFADWRFSQKIFLGQYNKIIDKNDRKKFNKILQKFIYVDYILRSKTGGELDGISIRIYIYAYAVF